MSRSPIRREPPGGSEEPRERFWRGMAAGLFLSSALVGVLATLRARMHSRAPDRR